MRRRGGVARTRLFLRGLRARLEPDLSKEFRNRAIMAFPLSRPVYNLSRGPCYGIIIFRKLYRETHLMVAARNHKLVCDRGGIGAIHLLRLLRGNSRNRNVSTYRHR